MPFEKTLYGDLQTAYEADTTYVVDIHTSEETTNSEMFIKNLFSEQLKRFRYKIYLKRLLN